MNSKKGSQLDRRRFLRAAGGSIALVNFPLRAQTPAGSREIMPLSCPVYPAMPKRLSSLSEAPCTVREHPSVITLENGYLAAEISKDSGLLMAVANKVQDYRYSLDGDKAGVQIHLPNDALYRWMAGTSEGDETVVSAKSESDSAEVVWLKKTDHLEVELIYKIRRDQFWIERVLSVKEGSAPWHLEELVYGRLEIPEGTCQILELGKFDRPRLVSVDETGGAFAGVGWWFYQIDESGTYLNRKMDYRSDGRFESEPWYVGVFTVEEGEPYPGWLWYKTFLELRKKSYDPQTSWSYWNAGWGQWGIDIDDPSVAQYLELIDQLGVRAVAFGSGASGKGIPTYVNLVKSDQTAGSNLRRLKQRQIGGGFLEHGGLGEKWADDDVMAAKLQILNEYADVGFNALHFDFFETVDTYSAHRNITEYFRATSKRMDYTECHLGMADYGPQFQNEVLLNHPTDLHGFDISHFSSDWATFLGFRQSRREWQQKYDYLMPEYSLYYYVTHYSNWGHPRRYIDPEPQQFFYTPHAYCGIAYNFHDHIGFRTSLAAAAAFTPFYVFGHLELKMPEEDVEFAASYLKWVSENVDVLSRARVCLESEEICVVSKIRDGKGAIFLINYAPGKRMVRLRLLTGVNSTSQIQVVYPKRGTVSELSEGEEFELCLAGEQVVILDVNQGLRSFPPENLQGSRLELDSWRGSSGAWTQEFSLPAELVLVPDPSLPEFLLSLDQVGETSSGILTAEQLQDQEVVEWVGRGPLPALFLQLYGFRERRLVETWRVSPWAFPNRVWLILIPELPLAVQGPFPKLEVNHRGVALIPRVDYRPAEVDDWTCPLFFADITDACNQGANRVVLSNLVFKPSRRCYVVSVALQPLEDFARIRPIR
jgi:hypothetical protein